MKALSGIRSCAVMLLVLGYTAAAAQAGDMSPKEREADFSQLVSQIRSTYGMLAYKKETQGIDLDVLEAAYRKQLEGIKTDEAFYDFLEVFVAEFKDAHFNLARPSTASADLGFSTTRIEGKAIITGISSALGPERFPFKLGDELVAIDGKPVATILRELAPRQANGRVESSLGLLTRTLTDRYGAYGPIPEGVSQVTIKPLKDGDAQSIALPWMLRGKKLPGMSFFQGNGDGGLKQVDQLLNERTPRSDVAIAPNAAAFSSEPTAPWSPDDANEVKNDQFFACMFDSPKGLLGYVRIPTFSPDSTDKGIVEFRKVIKDMRLTKGLIVDEVDNPGGSIAYMTTLASMLVDKPLELPLWAMRASRTTLSTYRRWTSWTDDAVSKAAFEYRCGQIQAALEQGLSMTPFGYGWGRVSQAPDKDVRYLHPVLILTNDQCYSCGDMFPALLQDNKRARTFGTTTAGAGGSVIPGNTLSYSGVRVRITETVYKRRPGDGYIENVGVKPDVPYELSQADVADNFKAYKKAYTDALLSQIQ